MAFKLINVGIAEIAVTQTPDILRTILGSCVGICLYDKDRGIGGLAHVMLPTSKQGGSSPKKYADTAIPMLADELVSLGAGKLVAKIVGGAMMFNLSENSLMGEIGKNNVSKAREILEKLNISIAAEDTGGNYGRTIDFYLETGEVKVKSIGKPDKIL